MRGGELGNTAGRSDAVALAAKTGWSASGNLITGDNVKEEGLSATFSIPGAYTVQFDLERIDPAPNVAIRAEATIARSVEGTTVTRVISVGQGVSISGVGQGVSVRVKDVTCDPANNPGDAGFEYRVAITVAPGLRAQGPVPPCLNPFPRVVPLDVVNLLTVAAGLSTSFDIPQGKGIVSVHVTVVETTNAPIPDGEATVGQGAGGIVTSIQDPRFTDWMPIYPGAETISLSNNSAAGTFQFSVVFGVDG